MLLRQIDIKTINTLREQLFYIFVDEFDEETLINNGVLLTDDDLKTQLKRRIKIGPATLDIYNMGLSIHEKRIMNKLSIEHLKPSFAQDSNINDPIMNSHCRAIIEKLHELITINTTFSKENAELKKHILALEKKMESMNQANIIDKQNMSENLTRLESKMDHLVLEVTCEPQIINPDQTKKTHKASYAEITVSGIPDTTPLPSIPNT